MTRRCLRQPLGVHLAADAALVYESIASSVEADGRGTRLQVDEIGSRELKGHLRAPPPVIDFDDYIAAHAAGFVGREWVFAEIDAWLRDDSAERVLLITGEPGAGKTAIAAQLTRFANGAVTAPPDLSGLRPGFLKAFHFCYGRELQWVSPQTFARSMALQLSAHLTGFAQALVETSSLHSVTIQSSITVGSNLGGQVVANWINTLNIPAMSSQMTFGLLFGAPLAQLMRNYPGVDPEANVVILIDGIDDALAFRGDDDILSLISRCEELKRLRLILLGRPSPRVLSQVTVARRFSLSSDEQSEKSRADIVDFVQEQLHPTDPAKDLVDAIADKAAGNFRYASFLLSSAFRQKLQSGQIEALPPGLDDLYAKTIAAAVQIGGKSWDKVYAPVLGILCVALDHLSADQLQAFTGLSRSDVRATLIDLAQFVRETRPADGVGEPGYDIFHQSFAEMLAAAESSAAVPNLFEIPPAEAHARIVEFYRQGRAWADLDFAAMDNYGLLHLPVHAHALHDQALYRRALHDLLGGPLCGERWSRFHSQTPTADDARLLIDSAARARPPDIVGQIRGCLILASIRSMTAKLPSDAIEALALSGYPAQAYGFATLIDDAAERQKALIALHGALLHRGDAASARSVFNAFGSGLLPENLPAATPALAMHDRLDRIEPALTLAPVERQGRIRKNIVQSLCDAGNPAAANLVIDAYVDPDDKVRALSVVIRAGAEDRLDPALAIVRGLDDCEGKASLLTELAVAVAHWNPEQAGALCREALAALDQAPAQWRQLTTLCHLVTILPAAELPLLFAAALRIAECEVTRAETLAAALLAEDDADQPPGIDGVVRRVERGAATVMSLRLTGICVRSQVPEVGEVVIRSGLRDDDIRANALNWLAQTAAALRPERTVAVAVARGLEASLRGLPVGHLGIRNVALGYAALILAQVGEAAAAKALIDETFDALRARPVTPEIYCDLLMAICPAYGYAGDLEAAIMATRPIKPESGDEDRRDPIWSALVSALASTNLLQAAGCLKLIKSADARRQALISLIRQRSPAANIDRPTWLAAIGELNDSVAKESDLGQDPIILSAVAVELAHLGLADRAATLAFHVVQELAAPSNSEAKARALASMADALSSAGEQAAATEVAEEAAAEAANSEGLSARLEAARARLRAGPFEAALRDIDAIDDRSLNKAFSLRDAAGGLALRNDRDRALSLCDRIAAMQVRADALVTVGTAAMKAGDITTASALAKRALDAVEALATPGQESREPRRLEFTQGEPSGLVPVKYRIVELLQAAGQTAAATALARSLAADPTKAAEAALALKLCGDDARAQTMLDTAMSHLMLQRLGVSDASAPGLLARALLAMGQTTPARELADKLLAAPVSLTETSGVLQEHRMLNAIFDVTDALRAAGQTDAALAVLERLIARAIPLGATPLSLIIRGRVLGLLTEMGSLPRAAEIWQSMLDMTRDGDRWRFFLVLRYGADFLQQVHGADALMAVNRSIKEVESWLPPRAGACGIQITAAG